MGPGVSSCGIYMNLGARLTRVIYSSNGTKLITSHKFINARLVADPHQNYQHE